MELTTAKSSGGFVIERAQNLLRLAVHGHFGGLVHGLLTTLDEQRETQFLLRCGAEIGVHIAVQIFAHHGDDGVFHKLHDGIIEAGLENEDFLL